MNYRDRLDSLDYGRSLATPADSRMVLLTGQSSFTCSGLTPAQCEFLQHVAPPQAVPLICGFPFHPEFDCDADTPGIAAASVRNALQFLWSRFSPAYRRTLARALQPLFTNTRQSLYIVTGSCGSQLLASAWPLLDVPPNLQVRIVAIGPAGSVPGFKSHATVQGEPDLWSRLLYRGPITARCGAGHLEYWDSQQTRQLVAELLQQCD